MPNASDQLRQDPRHSVPTGSWLADRAEVERALVDGSPALQDLMERFYALVGLGMALTDVRGRVLVAVGWQDICTRFHRVHPDSCRNCVESDTVLARSAAPGEYAVYRCKNNMWDVATPVVIGGHHLANVFFGQFFFDDEPPDQAVFEAQARQYGFDRAEYLQALERVPRVGRDRVRALMELYVRIARLATELTAQRVTIRASERARAIAEQDERVRRMFEQAPLGMFRTTAGRLAYANSALARLFGYDSGAALSAAVRSVDELFADPGERARILERAGESGVLTAEAEFRRRDGEVFVGELRLRAAVDDGGGAVELEGFLEDVTERRRAAAERQDRLVRDARLEGLQARVNEIELVVRRDGSMYSANDRALAAYGYSREEMVRLDIRDLRAPETRAEIPAQLARISDSGDTRFETIHVRKDGTRFPVEVSCRTFTVGAETLLHSLVRDLTEQRQREEQLRLNAALVSSMQEAVISIGLDLRVRSWAGAAESMYGFTAAEAVGQPIARLVQPDVTAAEAEALAARLASAEAHRLELKQRRKDGSVIFVDASTAVLRGPDGAVSGYLAVVRDVTEQKHAERELRRSEERLRLALEAGAHVTWEWDAERDVFTHGAGWREMVEATPEEVPDTFAGWKSVVHPDDLERAVAAVHDCLHGVTEEYDSKYRIRRRAGGWRWIRSHARAARRDASGRAVCLIGTRTDITETEELNRRLLEATRLASVGTLASGVAHEINNPLSYVRSNVDAALELVAAPHLDDATSRELRSLLADALDGTDRIGRIVKAMRSLGRPERPGTVSGVDVRGELLSALQMVRNQLAQRASLHVDIPDALPWVRSRTNELGRAFLNLLVNAAQAIPEGAAAQNRIDVVARTADGEVIVEISDSGCGFSDDVRVRMFDPFFTTKPPGAGTGLGLAIAKAIVEDANGRIEVERQAPRGARFRVVLPASRAEEPLPPAAPHAPVQARRRVLVVDDEPLVRRSLERMIRKHHEVVAVGSGAEALALIAADPGWDAILCDLMMSGMDGIAFHETLAVQCPSLLPRLAFITGGAFGQRSTDFLATHPVAVVPKPFDPRGLLDAIERLATGAPPPAEER